MWQIKWIYSWFFLMMIQSLFAQSDTVRMEDIVIRSMVNMDQKSGPNDLIHQEQNQKIPFTSLNQQLTSQSNIFIKNYGPGTLATPSIRGGSANHTLVLWNGFPIQHPMLGVTDLSLISMAGFNEVSLFRGGNSTLWGSGAVSGVISMSSSPKKSSFETNHSLQIGSFGRKQYQGNIAVGNKKWSSNTRYVYTEAENNYPYQLDQGDTKTLSNAAQQLHHVFQDLYFRSGANSRWGFHYWGVQAERAIPPLTTQRKSVATQEDFIHRAMISYDQFNNSSRLHGQIGYFNERIWYQDSLSLIDSDTRFERILADVQWDTYWNNHWSGFIGSSFYHTTIESGGNYLESPTETQYAAFGGVKYRHNHLHATLSQRWTTQNTRSGAWAPRIEIGYEMNSVWSVFGSLSRNFRLPTLNDLYWVPGGNIDLNAERGWSQEVQVNYQTTSIEWEVSAYHRYLQDFILWSLDGSQPFFQAQNLAAVRSQGIESAIKWISPYQSFPFTAELQYAYTHATNQKDIQVPKIDAGEQLWYTPRHQASFQFNYEYKNLNCNYHHQIIGSTLGQLDALEGYQIGNLDITYAVNLGSSVLTSFFTIRNIWNENYRVIERRPMPGRMLEAGITYHFKK